MPIFTHCCAKFGRSSSSRMCVDKGPKNFGDAAALLMGWGHG